MGEIRERPQAPTRHRLDVDAYYKMAEAGILTHPHRVELIDGEIFDMAARQSARRGYKPARAFIRWGGRRGSDARERPESIAP
jgi:hypothetical protein